MAHGDLQRYFPSVLAYESNDCLMWPFSFDGKGYGQIHWQRRMRRVHNLVCELTHGPAPQGMPDAAHTCGVRACVNKRHVRWASRRQNAAEGPSHTNDQRGARNKMSKLTEEQARAILNATESQSKIALRFGVSRSAVAHIKQRTRWTHLD
jgi:HNH endonuclease